MEILTLPFRWKTNNGNSSNRITSTAATMTSLVFSNDSFGHTVARFGIQYKCYLPETLRSQVYFLSPGGIVGVNEHPFRAAGVD